MGEITERSHGLVSLATMEARIAEAIAAEGERCIVIYESVFSLPKEAALRAEAARTIRERAK